MMVAPAGPSHQIWGNAELPSESSVDRSRQSTVGDCDDDSFDRSRQSTEGDPRASQKDAPRGCDRRTYRRMHPDVRRHMRLIHFNEESRTDDEFEEDEGTHQDARGGGGAGGTGIATWPTVGGTLTDATTSKLAACSIAGIPGVEHWSKGSDAHHSGQCRPCHYLQTKLGCVKGVDCEFCHLSHTKKSRPRPCKAKRTQCKRMLGMLDTVFAPNSDQFAEAAEMLSAKSPYMRTVIRSRMKLQEGEDGGPGAADAYDDGEENDRRNIVSL